MGWRSMDEIPPLFVSTLSAMSKGAVSEPLRGPSGFSLLRLVDKRDQPAEIVTEYHVRGLMVRTTDLVTNQEARDKIDKLLARIRGGEEFADVARENSDDQVSRARGGDMGWFPLNAWGPAVASTLSSLKPDEISEPFSSDAGWHVIKLLDIREQDVTRETERNRMREIIVQRKADEEFDRYLRELRNESYVDERLASTP